MKIGISVGCTAFTADPASLAMKCEALGFESVFFPEHPIIPAVTKTRYPSGDGSIPDSYSRTIDPFIGLALAATATKRMAVGTAVCLVPEHEPLNLAKQIATLDHFAGGRFIFGVGAGWLREESEIMGVDFRRRWQITEEYCRAMKEIWTHDVASYQGEFVSFPGIKSYPKPARKPHPPIHIGAGGLMGHSELAPQYERALQHTVDFGDGWAPVCLTPDSLAAGISTLKEMCETAGRDFSTIEVSVFFPIAADNPGKNIADYREAGAHRLVLRPAHVEPDRYEQELEKLAKAWIA